MKKYTKEEIAELPFRDGKLDIEKRVEDLIHRLTLNEKISLMSGRWDLSTLRQIKRLGIPSFKMTDGPHGLGGNGLIAQRFKRNIYFPVPICRAATWNPELQKAYGAAVGRETRGLGFHMNLAPGINIMRTPLCGRNFEYFTEDPHLNSQMAVAQVKGTQSQRIAACVKHYVANNQDTNRLRVSSEVSERALQEIYLPAFEATVREADAWSFMSCYNKVNGIYGSENYKLIKEKLMKEWGFKGFVVSDWFATKNTLNTESCMIAGLSLEMPYAIKYRKRRIRQALKDGFFTEETINDNVKRFLRAMFLVGLFDDESSLPKGTRLAKEHCELAREIAEEGIVLLKNEKGTLPLDIEKIKTIAVLGPNAKKKHSYFRFITQILLFGGGSSAVRSPYEITPLEGIQKKCNGNIKIVESAAEADVAIIFAGLGHRKGQDSEGADRSVFELPEKQVQLINETAKVNSNTVVVLVSGSPVAMEGWIENVSTVLEMWYAGLESGRAIANVLFGEVNPSGKLPITFPRKLSDSPAHISRRTYPGRERVHYDEGIFVGYRHFDTRNIKPQFPFGFGLSYTSFKYENLQLNKKKISANDKLAVTVDVQNTGERDGAEIIQLYVQDVEVSVERPLKELKGFSKVRLKADEKKTVMFELSKRDLSFYDENEHCWKAEEGVFKILVGSSSRDIRLEGEFEYTG